VREREREREREGRVREIKAIQAIMEWIGLSQDTILLPAEASFMPTTNSIITGGMRSPSCLTS
jgi:hypothetical protein